MTPERWQQINKLYHDALELEADRQATFLNQACAGDAGLRDEVESLIVSHDQAGSFIAEPALKVAARVVAEDQATSLVGRSFSHYRIESLLGVGGMGEVYLAEDSSLDRKVALKLLPAHFTNDAEQLRRFEREARAASALNHPNILTIYEIGQVDGHHYTATEFIDGETLRDHMASTRMQLDESLDVAAQVASALAAAHEAGIVHRDIKPENVMVRPDGYVKVLDFGLAKLVEQKNKSFIGLEGVTAKQNQTAKGMILGTVNYMSPEQAKGERVDERTDIFSFGVVIYEMIAGRTPFAGDSMAETFANLINVEPQPLSRFAANVPDELKRIVAKTLRKNKEERYQTMKDVLTDLKDLKATTGGVNKQTAETQFTFSRTIRQHKTLAAVLLVALLTGAIALGYYFFYAGKSASSAVGKKSIAVLPLKPINSANRDEIYEIGIADSLILKLSSMKGFIVRPLSATRKYADVEQDPLAAGREQKVDYVLASNYQLAGGKIRVTSQLFNVASGQIEETYKSEKDTANVFGMQDAIAAEVGNIFSARFGSTSSGSTVKRGTTNEEAYRLYLQGMYLVDKRDLASSRKAVEVLEQAVRLDPNYAEAWAGKAHAHRAVGNFGRSTNTHEEYQKSIEAINKALALDANLADAHSALCENKMNYEWDFEGAERECKRAVELEPNSSRSHDIYARFLWGRERFDEAVAEIKTAIDLEPTSLFSQRNYGNCLYFARRYPEAVTQLKRVIAMDPNFGSTYPWLLRSLEMQGNYPEAFEWFMKAKAVQKADEETIQLFKTAYQTSGWRGILLEEVRGFEDSNLVYFHGAILNAKVGNKDKAFEYLEKSYQRRELWMHMLKVEPSLDSLRDDPRFDELVKRVGLK